MDEPMIDVGAGDRELDHVGVAVADLDAASAPYLALGLTPLADEEVAGQGVRVRAFDAGGTLVELLAATTPDSPIARYLDRRGPGRAGTRAVFLHPRWGGGVLIELVEHA